MSQIAFLAPGSPSLARRTAKAAPAFCHALGGHLYKPGGGEGSSFTCEKVETVLTAGICDENATMENLLCVDLRGALVPHRVLFQQIY